MFGLRIGKVQCGIMPAEESLQQSREFRMTSGLLDLRRLKGYTKDQSHKQCVNCLEYANVETLLRSYDLHGASSPYGSCRDL